MQRIQIITDKNATFYHSITLIFNKKTKKMLLKNIREVLIVLSRVN
jgi:hypothetical protein